MKIAFVNDTFIQGRGADTVIYELAKRLGKRHEVFVIAVDSDMPEENFKILKIKGRKLFSGNTIKDSLLYFPNVRKIRKEIIKLNKKYSFDILNLHHSSLNLALRGFPVVVTWHGSPISDNKIRIRFNKFLLRSLKRNRVSITVSDYLKKELSKVVGNIKIKRMYNGVGKEFEPIKKARENKYMFYVGRLEEHKCVSELIRLSRELDYPLHIAGAGPLENYLKEYSKRIGANKVKFLGRVSREELIEQYQSCSFFVSASKWEGFGLIFIEAGACGKPSIAYNRGSVSEVIEDKKTGFLVDNYSELKQKAKILVENKKLREKMGKNALELSKRFTWEIAAKGYERILEND